MSSNPGRNVAMELVRATEAGALGALRYIGKGDKNAADGAAVEAMRNALNGMPLNGFIVIGEGEKDDTPMLANGEYVATYSTDNTARIWPMANLNHPMVLRGHEDFVVNASLIYRLGILKWLQSYLCRYEANTTSGVLKADRSAL